MNFQTMNKQRKFILIAAAVGIIAMFLPWVKISFFGIIIIHSFFMQINYSKNRERDYM